MSHLDDAREALADARRFADDLGKALDVAERALANAAADQELDRLRALSLAMSPKTPDLVGDHVPAEWLDEPKNGEQE